MTKMACCACRQAGVDAIFSGHDHDNDFDATWQGMRYVYGCARLLSELTLTVSDVCNIG